MASRCNGSYGTAIQTGVITGRESQALDVRAKQVGMTYVYQGHIEKVPILDEIIQRSGFAADQIAYVGDDLTDVPILRRAGLAFAPANARAGSKMLRPPCYGGGRR